jgi:hypothetical protein
LRRERQAQERQQQYTVHRYSMLLRAAPPARVFSGP